MSLPTHTGRTDPVFEVEFRLEDTSHPFVGLSKTEGCVFELAEMVPRGDGEYAEFFNVIDVDPSRILALGETHDAAEISLLAEYDHGGLFEFTASKICPAVMLAELGALPREVRGADGEGRIVAEIPAEYDPAAIIETFLDANPGAEIVAKQVKDSITPLFSQSSFQCILQDRLTDRQREVLETAFEAGYYEWPRECTGTDVAEELGISSATFSEHIHAIERKLFTLLVDDST